MARAEVTVRGAGVIGLAIAWECARRGARVQVVEPRGIGAGASGGPMGALAPHLPAVGAGWTPLKAFQRDCLLAAGGFWGAVRAAGGGDPGHARTGRLQPLADAAAVARAEAGVAAAGVQWGGQARMAILPAPPDGWPRAPATGLCLFDDLSGRLHPRRALEALAAALAAAGGRLVLGEAADEGAVVWATGWEGLAALAAALGRDFGAPVKGQALVLHRPGLEGRPQVGGAGGLYVVPHADGRVAVGATAEKDFADPAATDGRLEALHAAAIALCPALAGAPVLARWAGLRPRAMTGRPVLGPWPGRAGHFVANGAFRIGFGLAPGIAGLIADLVLEGHDAIPEGLRLAPG